MKFLINSPLRHLLPVSAALLVVSAVSLSAAGLNSDDADFLKKAAKGGMAEVELGRMAVKNASSPEVKEFGSKMIRDHSKANQELRALAASKGVDLPTSKSLGDDVSVVHLKMLSGKSFDEAYVKMMVDDHKGDVADFEKEAESAQDPDVKKWAAKTLPTLQGHLTKIQQIQGDFGGSSK